MLLVGVAAAAGASTSLRLLGQASLPVTSSSEAGPGTEQVRASGAPEARALKDIATQLYARASGASEARALKDAATQLYTGCVFATPSTSPFM